MNRFSGAGRFRPKRLFPFALLFLLLSGRLPLAVGEGADVVHVLEALREVARGAEPDLVRYLGDVQFHVVAQHQGAFLEADGEDEVVRGLSGDGLQLGEEVGARHAHFAGEDVDVELRVVQMLLDDAGGTVQDVLVYRVGGKHLGVGLRLLAELLLQEDARVHQIVAARYQQVRVERLGDVVVRTGAQAFDVLLDGGACGEQHYRDVAGVEVALQLFAEFRARHLGHHHVAHHDVRHLLPHQFQSLFSVGRRQHPVEGAEDARQHLADGGVVFYDDHLDVGHAPLRCVLLQFGLQQGGYFGRLRLFGLPHVFALLADLLGTELTVAQLQADDEAAALAQFAFYANGAVVQLYDALRQCQTDACSGAAARAVRLFGLIETVEYLVRLLGVDAASGVRNADHGFVALGGDAEGDGVFGLRVLDGVREEVVHHLLHLLLVVPHFEAVGVFLEQEVDLLAVGVLHENQVVLVEEVHDVVRADLHLHVPLLLLAEVEQLGDELAQLYAVLVDAQYLVVDGGREVLQLHQRLHLRDDERERRAELVRDVGEEAQLRLVQGLYVLYVLLLVLERFAQLDSRLVGPDQIPEQDARHYEVDEVGERRPVVGRKHVYGEAHLRAERFFLAAGLDKQVVGAGVQVGVRDDGLSARTVPVVRESLQFVDDVVFVGGYVVGRGKLDAEHRLVGVQRDLLCVAQRRPRQDARIVAHFHLRPVHDQAREDDAVGLRGEVQLQLVEGYHALRASEEYLAVVRGAKSILVDGCQREAVLHAVVSEPSRLLVEDGEPLVGGQDQLAARGRLLRV